ncbi:hypothetical protein Ae201684P_015872 [Aphanomyces euteiches]|nr:hypothetical protein Ae201684P_015872 [Aphanomyces euteiches]
MPLIDRIESKRLVLTAARQNENWRYVANLLGVNEKTAANWVSRARTSGDWEPSTASWGGSRNIKVQREHIECLLEALGETPDLTLEDMASIIATRYNVVLSPKTISLKLDGEMFSLKKKHYEPQNMNTIENKVKKKLWRYESEGKEVFYVDETNNNTWCSREYAWSKVGRRAVGCRTSAKSENLQVIVCIWRGGLVYWRRRYGSNKASDMKIFMSELLRTIPNFVPLGNSVVVLDNAPCHSGVEVVFLSEEFAGSCLLRLAPYSPMLNPIENVFSTFKASVRQYLRRERRALLTVPLGSTIRGHRAAMLERAADLSITVISAALCWSCFQHTRQFYVAVMNLEDCGVGQ